MKKMFKWGFCLLLVFAMLFAFAVGCSPAGEVEEEVEEEEVEEEEVVEEEVVEEEEVEEVEEEEE